MHAVLSTECRTEYSRLDLDFGQARGGEKRLLDFQPRQIRDGEKDVGAEIRVDDGLERKLQLLEGESSGVIRSAASEIRIVSRQNQRCALAESGYTIENHRNIGVEALKKTPRV